MKTYCLVCKKNTDNNNSETVENKGRLMMKSIFPICGNKKSRFISQGSGLFDSLGLNTPQNRMKNFIKDIINRFLLIGDKFMPEIYLWDPKAKKYSACGPFTRH